MCINFSYGPSTWESILLVILLKRKGELHNTLSQKQCIRVSAKVGSKNEPYFNLDNLEKVSMMPNEIIFKFHQRGVTVTKPKHISTAVEFSHTSCLVKHHCPTPPPPLFFGGGHIRPEISFPQQITRLCAWNSGK